MSAKRLLMLGTHFNTMGGISSVVNVYREYGLFDRLAITYLPTHCNGGKLAKLSIMARAYLRFFAMLARGQVGAVHAHVASRASFWRKAPLLRLAQKVGIPTVVHLHGAEFHLFYEQECSPAQQRRIKAIFEDAACAIALSTAWADWIRKCFPRAKATVIPNPVRIPAQVPAWSERLRGVVLSLGQLGKRKGTYDLIQAVSQMPPQRRCTLRLGGDGEVDQARQQAHAMGIAEQVQLLGWVRGADKDRHLAQAWVYTLPSYNEGLPMSLLEAMAAGLPVVTTPIGGIPEAVTDGVEGYLIPPGDVTTLRDRLMRLCDDAALAERMGHAARQRAQAHYSIEAIAPQLQAVYAAMGWNPSPSPSP